MLEALARRHALSVALTLRAIGLVSLAAFVSLHVQVVGLFGERGIEPIATTVAFFGEHVEHPWTMVPSLFLVLGGSSAALHGVCVVGELASLATVLGVGGPLGPLVAYACYLSFVSLGAPFVPLQWDTLLVESLVIAAIASPLTLRPVPLSRPRAPEPFALFALWLLVGRLMFAAGYVKLASGDEAWSSLRALDYHFETQPLPTRAGWLMHFAPSWMRTLGVALTFAVELGLPWAILFGRVGRRVAAGGFVLLMALIAATGNYGFFDFLAIALSLSLVDDEAWARLRAVAPDAIRAPSRALVVVRTLAATQMAFGLLAILTTLGARPLVPDAVTALDDAVDPFHVASGYGLFAVMTRERPIVVFEGSDDGETWRAYDYRWQSGDPARPPEVCMPHMPRLDWMIWFAGLRGEPEPWIVSTEIGLLEARPEVLSLFGDDPFEGHPPRYVRSVVYDYAFAAPGDVAWWSREGRAPFGPTLEHRAREHRP